MSPEWISIYITVIGFIGTLFNVYLTSKIKADISEMKTWVLEEFVRREDMPLYMGRLADRTQAGLSGLRTSQSQL